MRDATQTLERKIVMQIDARAAQLGISNRELARRAGVSPEATRRLYQGRTVTIETLRKMVEALGGDLHVDAWFGPVAHRR